MPLKKPDYAHSLVISISICTVTDRDERYTGAAEN